MTGVELEVIDRYLDAPQGSRAAQDALADLISLADERRDFLEWSRQYRDSVKADGRDG